MITAPLPRASPSGSGRLSMIIPQNHGLTITYMSVVKKKKLNRTLEIDSPFQTLTVGLLVEFID